MRTLPLRMAARGSALLALVASAAFGAAVSAPPAVSAADPSCPPAVPVGSLVDGQPVHGLTVTKGTTPSRFTGTVQGVLEDALAPGVDLVLVDLHSPTIDKVGIWQGMSGSPVYAADGRLVGAVSYSFAYGPTTIAGVTPGPEMVKLLHGASSSAAAARPTVRLPESVARRLVRRGAAGPAEVSQGLQQLPLPHTVSGVLPARLPALSRRLGLGNGHLTAGASGGTGQEAIPIVAGGNMATSVSYGTVTFALLGTATLVCGGEVVGFGHPALYSGPSSMTLHGARTVLIQPDPVSSGFVLANVGAPVGAVDNDRLVGLHALTGAPPAGSLLTSRAVQGRSRYTATTRATVPSWLPDIAFLNLVTAQDRVLDRLGGGTVDVSWTIRGERPDGKPFAQRHRQTYRVVEDVSGAVANLLAEDVYRTHALGVHVDSVSTVSRLNDSTARYRVTGVQVQRGDSWVTVRTNRRTALPAGARTGFRVLLTSPQGQRTAVLRLTVPRKAAAHRGTLRVLSGGDGVRGLRHDQIRVSLRFPRAPGAAARPRAATVSLLNIVRGRLAAPVAAVR